MSSGMNTEQAKEYAKTMTYGEAVRNVKYGKFIKYRKATMIKLRELAEIADALDRKTEPQPCEWCKFYDGENCFSQEPCKVMLYFKTEPQTEYDKYREKIRPHDPHKDWFEDDPQTDCAWK